MLLDRFHHDYNIVQIFKNVRFELEPYNRVHNSLRRARSIAKGERKSAVTECPSTRDAESCEITVLFRYYNLMKGLAQVQFGYVLGLRSLDSIFSMYRIGYTSFSVNSFNLQ